MQTPPSGPAITWRAVADAAPGFALALIVMLAIVAAAACGAGAAPGSATARLEASPNRFAADALWDDGRAEINAYEAIAMRYGVPRPFTAYHVVVKEDFSRRQLVKADPGHDPEDLVTVLKLNQVLHYQTGIYAYHQMVSSFHARVSMDLVKLTLASFEWCGNSFKEYTRRGRDAALHVHTYWDGQAGADYPLPAGEDVVLYDSLPLWVRSLPQIAGAALTLRLVPDQVSSRGPRPELRPATLRAGAEEPIETPAGSFTALRWELDSGDGRRDVYWTARAFPHLLVAWDRADGGRYRLLWSQRLAYWEMNRPGDDRRLAGPAAGGRAAPADAGP